MLEKFWLTKRYKDNAGTFQEAYMSSITVCFAFVTT